MKNLNLSRWALEHKSLVVYLMLIIAIAGTIAYGKLGREEDPPFTIKTMVVKTLWPGATTLETIQQVTDRVEKKLEELPNVDYLKSYTKPGESVVMVTLKDATRAGDVPDIWYQARKKVGDIKQTLPQGIQGPFFNDEFGDTYSLIFALTSDGFSHRELRDHAERLRGELLSVPDVAKIDLIGTQDEKIYLEFSTQQLAAMGLDISSLIQTLQAQNAIQPSGTVDAGAEKIAIRISGQFTSEESLKAINFRANGRFFRLSDIAKVHRTYVDPQQPMFRYNGAPAVGLAISMAKSGNVLVFGEHMKERLTKLTASLPLGIEFASGRGPTASGGGGRRRVHQDADRGRRHRAGCELSVAGLAAGHRRCRGHPVGSCHHLCGHEDGRHQFAAHLPGCPHYRAWAFGRRRHDRR